MAAKKVSASGVWALSIMLSSAIFGTGAYFISEGDFSDVKDYTSESKFMKNLRGNKPKKTKMIESEDGDVKPKQ